MNDHEQKSKTIQYPSPSTNGSLTATRVFVPFAFRPPIFPKFQILVVSWEIQHINFLPEAHLNCSPIAFPSLHSKTCLPELFPQLNRFNSCIPPSPHELIEQTLTYYLERCKSFSS